MTGLELIAQERARQKDSLGWTMEHDSLHDKGEIPLAASCYVALACAQAQGRFCAPDVTMVTPPSQWPWERAAWKPKNDPVKNLVRAGALIAAEIDRIQSRG